MLARNMQCRQVFGSMEQADIHPASPSLARLGLVLQIATDLVCVSYPFIYANWSRDKRDRCKVPSRGRQGCSSLPHLVALPPSLGRRDLYHCCTWVKLYAAPACLGRIYNKARLPTFICGPPISDLPSQVARDTRWYPGSLV